MKVEKQNPQEITYGKLKRDGVSSLMTWQYPGHSKATIFEFFAFLETIDVDTEKVNLLRKFASVTAAHDHSMHVLMECFYHPKVVFDLPPGCPPFDDRPGEIEKFSSNLLRAIKKLSYYLKGGAEFIAQPNKREAVFIKQLCAMHPGESYLMIAMKEKDDTILRRAATKEIFMQAYPAWFSDEMKKKTASPKEVPAPQVTPAQVPQKRKPGRPKGTTKAAMAARSKQKEAQAAV